MVFDQTSRLQANSPAHEGLASMLKSQRPQRQWSGFTFEDGQYRGKDELAYNHIYNELAHLVSLDVHLARQPDLFGG